jgi:glycerol-3-phosphate cytidylyltransferase
MERSKKIIGITCSTFDLLHPGHIIMLEECKRHCDYLICALQNDPTIDRDDKNKPIQSLVERYLQLDAVKYVDKIIPYNTEDELEELFSSLDLDVRIIGEDYKDKYYTAKDICVTFILWRFMNPPNINPQSVGLSNCISVMWKTLSLTRASMALVARP